MSRIAAGLAWLGARARWVLAVGVLAAMLLPALSAVLRPALPAFVALIVCVAMLRLDLGWLLRRALDPRRLGRLLVLTALMMVLTPAILWAVGAGLGLPETHVAALVYTAAAPPIASSVSLCLILGLDAALALELTVIASVLTPLIGPVVTRLLLGEALPLDAVALGLRLAAILGAGTLAALVIRRLAGRERLERAARPLDGIAALAILVFVIPLFDGVWALIGAGPLLAFGVLALAIAANWGMQALVARGARAAAGAGTAGAAGLVWGNRTVALYVAALPYEPVFALYTALFQLPILLTPLVMGRVLGAPASPAGQEGVR
jgi:predicted Na+-dependent transporter